MGRWAAAVGVLAVAVAGCGKKPPADQVSYIDGDDPRMNAAMSQARATVKTFVAALKSPKPGQSGFSVKVPFTDGPDTEHMWLKAVRYDGAAFHGTVDNRPEKVRTVTMGQSVSVAPDKISDWMYLENRKLVGGRTLRVLRDNLPPAERADFDKGLPFVIE